MIKAETITSNPAQLLDFDGFVRGSPTYLGGVSGPFKSFMDATGRLWRPQQLKGKLTCGFTVSALPSGARTTTLLSMFTFSMQHGMIWVSQGLMPSNTKAAQRNDVNYLVSYSGAIAQSPSDAGAGDMLPGDLETARLFGERVASVAAKFSR